jgi:hypothetical protein
MYQSSYEKAVEIERERERGRLTERERETRYGEEVMVVFIGK